MSTEQDQQQNRRYSERIRSRTSSPFLSLRRTSKTRPKARLSSERPDSIVFRHYRNNSQRNASVRRPKRFGFCFQLFPAKIFVRLSRRYRECRVFLGIYERVETE